MRIIPPVGIFAIACRSVASYSPGKLENLQIVAMTQAPCPPTSSQTSRRRTPLARDHLPIGGMGENRFAAVANSALHRYRFVAVTDLPALVVICPYGCCQPSSRRHRTQSACQLDCQLAGYFPGPDLPTLQSEADGPDPITSPSVTEHHAFQWLRWPAPTDVPASAQSRRCCRRTRWRRPESDSLPERNTTRDELR